MDTDQVIEICRAVLGTLRQMDYEGNDPSHKQGMQLIFPRKNEARRQVKRISEQELRLLFIDEFKRKFPGYFYSIETPTVEKFKFKDGPEHLKTAEEGCKSASTDMTIFQDSNGEYERLLNIEFKFHDEYKAIAKDIFKLLIESESGVFIQMKKNTNRKSFLNKNYTGGLFVKFHKAFKILCKYWNNENKSILIVILSIDDNEIIYKELKQSDMDRLDQVFLKGKKPCNITEIKEQEEWN